VAARRRWSAAAARTRKPIPESRRAIPTTMPKTESCSAMYEVLSAVERAVSLIQMLRAGLSTGLPFCVSARAGSFVPLPSAVA